MKISLLWIPPSVGATGEHAELRALARALGFSGGYEHAPERVASEAAVRRCARAGLPALLSPLPPERERRLVALYAAESGRAPGEGVAPLRDLLVADSDGEALALWSDTDLCCGRAWFEERLGAEANLFEDSLALVGSADTVRRQLAALRARLPVREIAAWIYPERVPQRALARSLELFATRVLPGLGADPAARPAP